MDGTTNGYATFDELVAKAGKRRFDTVDLPVCKLTVRIRSLFEREVSDYYAVIQSAKDNTQRHNRLKAANRQFIALCLVDGDGNPIVEPKQVGRLADMDAADASHLYDECARHVGINKQDVEDMVKNSETMPPDDSPTNSPTPSES